MIGIVRSQFGVKAEIATTAEQVDKCERLIEQMFGRVMRFGIEPVEQEKVSSHIQYHYCSRAGGDALSVVKVIDADYLVQSPEFRKEYRLDKVPQELLPYTVVVVGLSSTGRV